MSLATSPGVDSLQKEVVYRKRLAEITNLINSAPTLQDILVSFKDKILELLECDRVTVYALDTKNQELFSLYKAGTEVKEIRVPKTFASIAGFTALSRKTVNIKNAYDAAELTRLHANLKFDQRWDKSSGFKTRQVLSAPVLFDKYLLGVLQLINKRPASPTPFTERDEEAAAEIARILGIAFYNQHKSSRTTKPTKFGALIDKGLISEAELDNAASSARANNVDITKILVETYHLPKEEVAGALASFYSCKPFLYTGAEEVPKDLKERLPIDFLKKNMCAPVERKAGVLVIAVEDPQDLIKMDAIKALNLAPRYEFLVGLRGDILEYVNASYGVTEDTDKGTDIGKILVELGDAEVEDEEKEPIAEVDETDSGIVKLANQLIIEAYNRGASDIHVEPNGKDKPTIVRFRIDGDCVKYLEIPSTHRSAIVQRLKIMAKLDISEKRKPQDGKIRFRGPMGQIELRVATIPTSGGGEDVVMRILAASKPYPLEQMGFTERNLREFKAIMQKPYGICLVVGPTGSGKTTTLHSGLGFINTEDMKIWTAEDPVEITQYGLRQVQVHPKIDFTFAVAMRSFLRADPDVIMVGEMRDHETAQIGIEASLTGHLVFSTLHTNSAPETIVRLLDMDIDPFNFADALLGILAQRLIRTLCKSCKEPYHPEELEWNELIEEYGGAEKFNRMGIAYTADTKLYRPKGCKTCSTTGYKGRMGIHELIVGTDEMKRLVALKSGVPILRQQAVADGMTTLLQDGIEKVLKGHADFKQVRAVCIK